MKFGVCGDFTRVSAFLEAGFESIELPVFDLFSADRGDAVQFEEFARKLEPIDGKFKSFNCLVPATLPLVGPDSDILKTRAYMTRALDRVWRLGGTLAVFGSGGARMIPEGYSLEAGHSETVAFLQMSAELAKDREIEIAIEPLNRRECNWINSVSEAVEIAKIVDDPAVRVLSDLYHVAQESESYDGTRESGALLAHVHVASPITRNPVTQADIPVLAGFFKVLKEISYSGRIALECNWTDVASEAPIACRVLSEAWEIA